MGAKFNTNFRAREEKPIIRLTDWEMGAKNNPSLFHPLITFFRLFIAREFLVTKVCSFFFFFFYSPWYLTFKASNSCCPDKRCAKRFSQFSVNGSKIATVLNHCCYSVNQLVAQFLINKRERRGRSPSSCEQTLKSNEIDTRGDQLAWEENKKISQVIEIRGRGRERAPAVFHASPGRNIIVDVKSDVTRDDRQSAARTFHVWAEITVELNRTISLVLTSPSKSRADGSSR